MNEVSVIQGGLPDNLQDLSRFVLIGTEKLKAVKAEITAIKKLGLAKEVYEQKQAEAQDISEAVQLASVQIGKLTNAMTKRSGGDRKSENFKIPAERNFETKKEAVEKLGLNKNQVSEFQQMADNEDIVKEALKEARENGDIPSRAFVLGKIKQAKQEDKKPHVSFNSGNNEWYTPKEYIEAARRVMGSIDLDPASSEIANKTVQAKHFYTIEDDGLSCTWAYENLWINPPYSSDLIGQFAKKIKVEMYKQAIVLVNNATETTWFFDIVSRASAIVFPTSRIKFYKPDGTTGAPLQGQAFIYIGDNAEKFINEFFSFGWGAYCGIQRRKQGNDSI